MGLNLLIEFPGCESISIQKGVGRELINERIIFKGLLVAEDWRKKCLPVLQLFWGVCQAEDILLVVNLHANTLA